MSVDSTIRIHLYRVHALEDSLPISNLILNTINKKSIEEKTILINNEYYRLESVKTLGSDKTRLAELSEITNYNQTDENILFYSVIKLRAGQAPGKATINSQQEPIDYGEDGFPTEDAGILYDPLTGFMAIQYAHAGPRAASIKNYLNHFSREECYHLVMVPDQEFKTKFARQNLMTRLDFKLDMGLLSSSDIQELGGIKPALQAINELGGATLTISISAPRGKGAALNERARHWAQRLLDFSYEKSDAILKLESKGPIEDTKPEIVDLLGGALVEEVSVPISRSTRQMDIQDRWDAIYKAYISWRQKGYIQYKK